MKLHFASMLLALIILLVACGKSFEDPIKNKPLSGKWNLFQTLADPGDGSGTWQTTDSTYLYVQFNQDSSFTTNIKEYPSIAALNSMIKYSVPNDSVLVFKDSNHNFYYRFYNITGNILTINGGCIEACGLKFKKND